MTGSIALAVAHGVEAFLRCWYGEPERAVLVDEGPEPEPLRRWWAYERAWSVPLTQQNHLCSRSELERDGDHTIFYVENQAVVHWGYRDDADHSVDERNWGEDAWRPVGATLERFLVAVATLEASFGPNTVSLAEAPEARARALVEGFDELPIDIWPGCRFWASDDLLVNAIPFEAPVGHGEGDAPWTVIVGARHLDDLSLIDDRWSSGWDHDSRVD